MKKWIYILAAAMLTASCGPTSQLTRITQYSKMYEEKPVTLLIMPPINNTTDVEAKEFLYSSISRPLIEAGYYVIPPFMAMDVFREESAYDAELFVESSLAPFRVFFGADAAVFSEINAWTKKGFGIEPDIRYFIKSTHTGEILFDKRCELYLDLRISSGSNSIIGQLIDLTASAINTAVTEHITAARKANYYIFKDLPRGKYSPDYLQDQDAAADASSISATVR